MIDFNWILFALSSVVLASYLFDFISSRSRIPSVVMLIASGIGIQLLFTFMGWEIAFVSTILPLLGTLGLVLIVLEGALELRLSKESKGLIIRSTLMAIVGILLTASLIALCLHSYYETTWRQAWLLATPFAVISSAVAIPAANVLSKKNKDFVVYESALSDIFGVLLFYALLDNKGGITSTIFTVVGGIGLSTAIGASFGILMVFMIQRIEAHVRFIPMIFALVLVYALSKFLHLAPLVTVFSVGIILNNLPALQLLPGLHSLQAKSFETDLDAFKHLTAEFTFVVRTFFFILLGYSTDLSDLAHLDAWVITGIILVIVFAGRELIIRAFVGSKTQPLIWFAPRGLITVLLFLSIPKAAQIVDFPNGALMLTVLGSILIMTFGSIFNPKQAKETS
jgi:cell volume regulation protein A